ncbi:MAG: uroporphyrinogen decarboxylase family protein [Armatimonadota bacterium]
MPTCFGTTPNYRRLAAVLRNEAPDRIPVYEFFSDTDVQLAAIGDWPMTDPLPFGEDEVLNNHIRAQYYLGYDYLSPVVWFDFTRTACLESVDSGGNVRLFLDEHNVDITCREDYERYPWPTPETLDYSRIENAAKHLPEGMKLISNMGGGLLEWGMWLMGTELFCMGIYDDPDFIREFLGRINDQQVAACAEAASHPDVFAVAMGDDMGFKTQTFLPPDAMREFVFPGLKRIVDAVHAQGKPFILHSCGNLNLVMDDLIDYVGIDAKHSFEDVIAPVTEVKAKWGDRVALLGGVDIDTLTRSDEETIRAYVRDVVAKCGPAGYAVGSGNSITNYIPPKKLRVMLEEAVLCQ